VVYGRPDHIAATEKQADLYQAFNGALEAVTRQIRERREKLKKTWEQPGNHPVEQEVAELLAAESEPADPKGSKNP
jgi:ribosome-associated translation inhibitor RaiA